MRGRSPIGCRSTASCITGRWSSPNRPIRGVREILSYQKNEANNEFAKFIKNRYLDWFAKPDDDTPVMSQNLIRKKVFPVVDAAPKTTFFLIDNFRYDQWRVIQPVLHSLFEVEKEDFYCSILPTATQYARNAIFAGLMPAAIDKIMPDLWLNDDEEGGKTSTKRISCAAKSSRRGRDTACFSTRSSRRIPGND